MNVKTALGVVILLIACVSYGFYFRDIFRRATKPHAFSWLVWGGLSAIIFSTQRSLGAGPGGWATAVTAVAALTIFALSLRFGDRDITRLDWLSLAAAAIIMVVWLRQTNPDVAVVLASAVFVAGFIPTFRKSYLRPSEETPITFGLNGLKFFLAVMALQSYSVATAFYPATLCLANVVFVFVLLRRRSRQ